MIEPLKLKLVKKRKISGLLGLALDGGRLEGVVLRRTNGSVQVQQSFSVTLSLDPLTADPELVGREIRNHLEAAGISERRCVFGLPLKWALISHSEIPELKGEDLDSFLQLEAERGFPCDVSTLQVATSLAALSADRKYALMVGIPRTHLEALQKVLRAAGLKPLSFSLAIVALQRPQTGPNNGVLSLSIDERQVGLAIVSGGGVVALRALEGTIEVEGGRRVLNAGLVAREARITLGQLPVELRDQVRRIRIFGPRDLAQQLADEMELRLESAGLKVEVVSAYENADSPLNIPPQTEVSPALSLATVLLGEQPPVFELLPPRVHPWQQMARRYSTGKWRMAGTVGAAAALIVLAIFLFQEWQLTHFGSQWKSMSAKVGELDSVQQQIRQYRPWYDDAVRGLSILRQLTTAFPEDGVVTAKTVEIRDLTTVTCTGTTRDNQSLIKTLDKLRAGGSVSDLRVLQIRGTKPPLQFTFDYHWTEGGKVEN